MGGFGLTSEIQGWASPGTCPFYGVSGREAKVLTARERSSPMHVNGAGSSTVSERCVRSEGPREGR